MTTFNGIKAAGNVTVTEVLDANDNKEYKFEYTVFDTGTGEQLAEKRVEIIQKEILIEEKTMLENRRDEEIDRYNDEIAEIDAKLTEITAVKS